MRHHGVQGFFPCYGGIIGTAMAAQLLPVAGSVGWHWLEPAGRWPPRRAGTAAGARSRPLGWTCFPRIATRRPCADARSVRAARHFIIATVRRRGSAERGDALRHALPGPGGIRPRPLVRLGLLQPGPCVLCAVADPAQTAPGAQAARISRREVIVPVRATPSPSAIKGGKQAATGARAIAVITMRSITACLR
jgi:hypothetical protein